MLPIRAGSPLPASTALPLLALVASLIHILYRRLRLHMFSQRHGCHQATWHAPVRDPIIGLDFIYDAVVGREPDRYLEGSLAAFRQLGPTYREKRWTWEVVYTCDSRNIKHMLAGSSFGDFALPRLRKMALGALLGHGIFSLDGAAWAASRAVLRTGLTRMDRGGIMVALERHFEAMMGRMMVPDGDAEVVSVDLQTLFFRLTMDFAEDFLMGSDQSRCSSAESFLDDYTACSREVVKRLRLGPLQHLRFNLGAGRARRRVFRFVDDFIADALARRRDSSQTLLAELAAVTKEEEKDGTRLRDQVLHLLLASRDTTASLLSNLFFVLARHPELYSRLREEVLAVVGREGAVPTGVQLKQMQYLRWCVQESLRLHPPIPTNAREATRDTTLPHGGGPDGESPLVVPKGIVVMYNVYALHRDQRVFGCRPDDFVPDRWRDRRPGWGFLPFSGGPRVCMGQQLALTEVHYIVARMAQTFETIRGHGERDWVGMDALATTCRNGVSVTLTRWRRQEKAA